MNNNSILRIFQITRESKHLEIGHLKTWTGADGLVVLKKL